MREIFRPYIRGERLCLPGRQDVDMSFFEHLFSSVQEFTHDNFVEVDGGQLGYIEFFDQCKADGVLQ